ncbi:uncharacterized protein [Haliotis asinina]|uniref:uncharacterized protein n=1 Tax=Haliotis asinina TaxID=109174 RepID=UPI00353228BB
MLMVRNAPSRSTNRQSGALYQSLNMARELGLPENHLRAARVQNIPDEIKALPYFYANFGDSKIAQRYVEEHAQGPGYYLLRLSSKGDNYLSLTVSIDASSVRHVNVVIERIPTLKYYIVEQLKFNSFQDLCKNYSSQRIRNLEQIDNVRLLHPIIHGAESNEAYLPLQTGMPITARRYSDNSIPKTPDAGKLTPQFDFGGLGGRCVDTSQQSTISRALSRRRSASNATRPLPEPPKTGSQSRPPCPPPPTSESNPDTYYSSPRDEDKNRVDELRDGLHETDLCECGVPLCDSQLPLGWTLHKSNDPVSYGCLFYQNAEGETTWSLPLHIVPGITAKMKNVIIKLSNQCGNPPPAVLFPPYQGQARGQGEAHWNGLDSMNDGACRESRKLSEGE